LTTAGVGADGSAVDLSPAVVGPADAAPADTRPAAALHCATPEGARVPPGCTARATGIGDADLGDPPYVPQFDYADLCNDILPVFTRDIPSCKLKSFFKDVRFAVGGQRARTGDPTSAQSLPSAGFKHTSRSIWPVPPP